jgi:type II secretory pathway component GspD/PulD (secretin)
MKKHLSIVICTFATLFLVGIFYWGNFTPSAKAQSEAVPAGAKGEKDERQLKIFTLTTDAETLTKTIQPLFADAGAPPTVIVFDKRTNTIIARARESELTILEALVLRLDETPDRKTPESD